MTLQTTLQMTLLVDDQWKLFSEQFLRRRYLELTDEGGTEIPNVFEVQSLNGIRIIIRIIIDSVNRLDLPT